MQEPSPTIRTDVALLLAGAALGAVAAVAYAAWRGSTGEGWPDFGAALLFPGALIVPVVAVIVWLGWKANIDG